MSDPCQKTELINLIHSDTSEIKGDVKLLLAHHHQSVGKRKFQANLTKTIVAILTAIASITYGLRH